MNGAFSLKEGKFIENSFSNFFYESFGSCEETVKEALNNVIFKKTIEWSEVDFDYSVVFLFDGKLYLKRDLFGNVPLYYFIANDIVYFSSEIINLIKHKEYDSGYNNDLLYSYLVNKHNKNGYSEKTIWRNLYSVIPGVLLEINNKKQKKYLNTINFQGTNNYNQDYYSDFKLLLITQLEKKIDFTKKVCCALSGGIDSSTISSFAQNISKKKIKTIEFRVPNEINPETTFSKAVVDKINSEHTIIDINFNNINKNDYFDAQERLVAITGLPSNPYSVGYRELKIIEEINKFGGKYYLTGQGGDDILITRSSYFNHLYSSKSWNDYSSAFLSIIHLYSKYETKEAGLEFINSILKFDLLRLIKAKEYRELKNYLYKVFNYEISLSFLKAIFKSIKNKIINFKLFKKNLRIVIKINNKDTEENGQLNFINEKKIDQSHYDYLSEIFRPQSIKNREQSYLIGKNYGIRFVNPFYDLKIIKFVHSTPKDLIFYNGFGRGLARKSGLLPKIVENRLGKTVFKNYHFEILKQLFPISKFRFNENHPIWNFVNRKEYFELGNKIINLELGGVQNKYIYNIEEVMLLIRVIYLGIWLDLSLKLKKN